jgi:hypothetical protein
MLDKKNIGCPLLERKSCNVSKDMTEDPDVFYEDIPGIIGSFIF